MRLEIKGAMIGADHIEFTGSTRPGPGRTVEDEVGEYRLG